MSFLQLFQNFVIFSFKLFKNFVIICFRIILEFQNILLENYFDILQYFCVMKKKIQKKIKVKLKNKLLKPCLIFFLGGQFQCCSQSPTHEESLLWVDINKARYLATIVAYWWAGAVITRKRKESLTDRQSRLHRCVHSK